MNELAPATTSVVLQAPLSGWLAPLSEVDDPVFSGRVLGDGVAIDPVSGTLCAPCDGVLVTLHRAHHALTLRAVNGAEILIHVGLDTVALGGKGFSPLVVQGQSVKAGDPLLRFDLDGLARQVRSLIVPILLTNGDQFALSEVRTGREIGRGDPLLRIAPLAAAPPPPVDAAAEGPTARRQVVLRDPNGIHARPAGLLAEKARQFPAAVTIEANGRTANARSAVSLMLLGARQNDSLSILAHGPMADEAAEAVAGMIEQGLDGPLPAPAATVAGPIPPSLGTDASEPAPMPPFAEDEQARLAGVTAAPGHAIGRVFRLTEEKLELQEAGAGPETEIAAFRAAVARAKADVRAAIDRAGSAGKPRAKILAAHLAFLEDPDLLSLAEAAMGEGKSAPFAWRRAVEEQVAALRRLGNPLLAERASDLVDIERRVLMILLGREDHGPQLFDQSILVAEDLLPSQLTTLPAARIAGICLAGGGPTSHVAIMAASMGIPALVAVGRDALRIPHEALVVLDADGGTVRVHPSREEAERIGATVARRRERAEENRRLAQQECRTADGVRIQVVANLGSLSDVPAALDNGAEGCGLLRSEFLFLDRSTAPSEDEQLAQYQAIATALGGRPLIIRTLDAGGDKDLPYLQLPEGENPALGLRGVRMSLWWPELLRTQLRAILRVQPAGQCSILLPMIATLADLRAVRGILAEEKAALGIAAEIPVGIMVEVPSAALMADLLAAEADFLSVGTNDLTQYTLAMDRGNPHLAKQLDAFHPALLRLIAAAAGGARAHGRWIGVCGGLAAYPQIAPVLIGLGVTELSVPPSAIPKVKAMVRTLRAEDCAELAKQALALESGEAVRHFLAERWPEL